MRLHSPPIMPPKSRTLTASDADKGVERQSSPLLLGDWNENWCKHAEDSLAVSYGKKDTLLLISSNDTPFEKAAQVRSGDRYEISVSNFQFCCVTKTTVKLCL